MYQKTRGKESSRPNAAADNAEKIAGKGKALPAVSPAQLAAEEEEPLQGKFDPVQKAAEEEEPLQGKFEPVQKAAEEEEPMQGKFEPVQKAAEEEEPLQGKFEPVQKAAEEEEPLQGKFEPVQKAAEEEEPLQGKFEPVQKAAEEEEPMQGKFEPVQKAAEEEEALQGKFETVQKQGAEEEEPMQGKFEPVQKTAEEEEPLQGKFNSSPIQLKSEPVQRQEDGGTGGKTGLPGTLKSGIENLSGFSMNDVKVHYNSDKPKQLQAYAYAQGTDIHIAPGQEKHLPHEAWHVAQQKQGRVQPTMQMKKGTPVNDDAGLEHEADVMGEKAMAAGKEAVQKKKTTQLRFNTSLLSGTAQRAAVAQRNPDVLDAPRTRARSTGDAPPPPGVTFHRRPRATATASATTTPTADTATATTSDTASSAPKTVADAPKVSPIPQDISKEQAGVINMATWVDKILQNAFWATGKVEQTTGQKVASKGGLAGEVTGAATGVSGKITNFFRKAKDTGVDAVGEAGHIVTGVGDSITALVAAVKNIKKAYDEADEGKTTIDSGLATAGGLLGALKSGFEAAASIQRFISGSVAPGVAAAIPGLGVAIAACEIISNAYIAYNAKKSEESAGEISSSFRGELETLVGPLVDKSTLFADDTRGKMGNRITYMRLQPGMLAELEEARALPGAEIDFYKKHSIPTGVSMRALYTAIKNYEAASKMQEINQKRKVQGARNIITSVIRIAGEIAKFFPADGGVTAAALVGTSAALSGGQKAAKAIQQLVRDSAPGGDRNRSKDSKHKEYVSHTKTIYQFLDTIPKPFDWEKSKDKVFTAEKLIRSTGVSESAVYATDYSQPSAVTAQINNIVEAMKAGR